MAINSNFYLHDSDRLALDALKAIPGFTQVLKAFMSFWNEKQAHIVNMSSNLRINENQLSKYYNMLPPICQKLGIDVPELYLELNVNPNAYTSGDTKPYIVMTTGLLETVPEELIPTVLAHECGHIACHHVLYTTMANFILNGAINLLGLSDVAILPIQIAFSYWMRCSELSADRAAAICDGTADKTVELCMHFAGFDKDINAKPNVDEFLKQADEYKELVCDNKWNKTLEFLMFNNRSHPLNAVRASECKEWTDGNTFSKIVSYLDNDIENTGESFASYLGELPLINPSKYYLGKNYLDVETELAGFGFTNIQKIKVTEKGLMTKNGHVVNISIDGIEKFEKATWFPVDAPVLITYYEPLTPEEIASMHEGFLQVPDSSKRYIGKNYYEVASELGSIGFTNIILEKQLKIKKGFLEKDGAITVITIDGNTSFEKGAWFKSDATVRINYTEFISKTEK